MQENRNKTENIGGRPKGSTVDHKEKILMELKRIWNNPNNKASDIIGAANLFADLKGLKIKNAPQENHTEIMKIEFTQNTTKPNEIKPLLNIENTCLNSHNEIKSDCPNSANENIVETNSNTLSDTQLDSEPVISSDTNEPTNKPAKNNLELYRERMKREKQEQQDRMKAMLAKVFPNEPTEQTLTDFDTDNPFDNTTA